LVVSRRTPSGRQRQESARRQETRKIRVRDKQPRVSDLVKDIAPSPCGLSNDTGDNLVVL
jgi:hypothetical protein